MAIINFFKRKPRTKAQTLVEFALVMPILLMVIYGLLEAGRLIFLETTVVSAAREAARYGSATGMVGGITQYKDCDGIKAAATKVDALGAIDPNRISIQYDHGPGTGIFASCSSTVNLKGGDRIIVTVQAEFIPVVGMVPFVSRTYAHNPLESENIRTILGRVKVKGSVGAIPPGLTVTVNGDGHVDTSDGKISACRDSCNASYDLADATVVTLTASPDAGTTFLSWGGDCSGTPWTDPCTIIMDTDRVVTADFSSSKRNLFVTAVGSGYVTGDITPLIDCGTAGHLACSQNYDYMAHVELTGNPGPGLHTYWGGACSGTDVACVLDMDSNKIVSVNFGPDGFKVDIKFPGQGTGTVYLSPPSPSGIDSCRAACEVYYPADTTITLTATADSDSHPDGWTGACTSGPGDCTITLDSAKSVSVLFDTDRKSLTVSLLGYGTGTVTSDVVPGINCTKATSPCSHLFDSDSTVQLTAAKDTDMDFTGWGGSCASEGTNPTCTLVMNQIQNVTATFDDPTLKTLTVIEDGTGVGMVTSASTPPGNPNPIACGSICSAAFPITTQVTLTAAPDSNSKFGGWIGPCAEADPATSPTCTVTMMAGMTVAATFEEIELDPCIYTQTKPVWSNSDKTITWAIKNETTFPTELAKLFIIWDGGNLTKVTIDGAMIYSDNRTPTGLEIFTPGRILSGGPHTIVYSYPNPTSIKGYNFNTTLYFVPSNCSPLTTGSWRVE